MLFWPLIILNYDLLAESARKNGYWTVYEKKSISDSRSVEIFQTDD